MPGFLGNPMGTVNRMSGGLSNTVWYLSSEWENAVINEMNNSLKINLQLKYYHFQETNGLFIHTQTSLLSDLFGKYHLIIYLVRKNIFSPQKFSLGIIDTNYNHHNVLSSNINGTWGTSIIDANAIKDSLIYNTFSFKLPSPENDSTFKLDNLSLISYVINRDNMKVLQVIKTDL